MKTIWTSLALLLVALSLASCRGDNNKPKKDDLVGTHFDIWTPAEGAAGSTAMGSENYLVQGTQDLEKGQMTFVGKGIDLSERLNSGTIMHGKYAYVVTKDSKLSKFVIGPNQLTEVKSIQFHQLKDRRFAHAWIDDNTLLLVGSNGPADKIVWVKISAEDLRILSEGTLDLPAPEAGKEKFNTSGMIAYRKADNTLIYTFCYNAASKKTTPRPGYYMAFINPKDMTIANVEHEDRADVQGSTAFGEIRQSKSFFDEKGDYYIVAASYLLNENTGSTSPTPTSQRGHLFRVKAGERKIDKSYNGYKEPRGKITAINYLGNGKAILYMQDPMHTNGTPIWDTKSEEHRYAFYFITLDLTTGAVKHLDLPYGVGNFVQPFVVTGSKCYIAANQKNGNTFVYTYEISTGKLTKGLEIANGAPIHRLVWVKE